MIKPEFWIDEKIFECSFFERLLFIACWNFCDDNGNLERSAKRFKAQAFPCDNVDCEEAIQKLIGLGLLVEYQHDGKLYLHVNNFLRHQKIDRPSPTIIPLYKQEVIDHSTSTRRILDEYSTNTRRALVDEVKLREVKLNKYITPLPPYTGGESSVVLNSLTLNEQASSQAKTSARVRNQEAVSRFNKFWEKYPRRVSKGQAERTWHRLNPDEQLTEKILQAVERAKTSENWRKDNGKFIPYASTWLNAKGWEDEHKISIKTGVQAWYEKKLAEQQEGVL